MAKTDENLEKSLVHAGFYGSLSATFLGMSHTYLKPAQRHPAIGHYVARYTYGSFINILALALAVRSARPKTGREIFWMSMVIWGISGAAVAAGYLLDLLTNWVMRGVIWNGQGNHS